MTPPPASSRFSKVASLASLVLATLVLALAFTLTSPAYAAGTFKLKQNDATEVSGAWHIFVKIELPKAPPMAHQPIRFVFTKTMVYERSLVDGKSEPVINRQSLQNQNPQVESLDVDFADASGKIYKGTNFDFGLKRDRGFEAGEYKMQMRTADGTDIGTSATLILKGDNPVVDRRAIAFNAKDTSIKKYDNGVDAGPKVAKNDEDPGSNPVQGDVQATGTPPPFVGKDAFNRTPEEDIKVAPKSGCGCSVPGMGGDAFFAVPGAALGLIGVLRMMRRKKSSALDA
jgi:MYXO-CTERM domain-containing protein